jgi:hypothetical protein
MAEGNGKPAVPKPLGRIVLDVYEGGLVNLQVQGHMKPFTIYHTIKQAAENYLVSRCQDEQAPKVQAAPGVPIPDLRG